MAATAPRHGGVGKNRPVTNEERAPTAPRWSGTAVLRPGVLEMRGQIGSAQAHRHHSVQVALATRGALLVEDGTGRQLRTTAVVIPPDQRHALRHGAADGLVVHLEPESPLGRRLVDAVRDGSSVAAWSAAAADLEHVWRSWLTAAVPDQGLARSANRDRHPALVQALDLLEKRVGDGPVSLAEVAEKVHLSASRLGHLMSAEVGLPFRPYVRWLRLRRAVAAVAGGQSLTAAAHAAGFADSAHLTRTWRAAFGSSPSDFGRELVWRT